jgi:hypothetical protein
MKEKSPNETMLNRPPAIFGVASIILPLLGVGLVITVVHLLQKYAHVDGLGAGLAALFVAGVVLFSMIFGLVFSIVGLWRNERLVGLSFLGLALNGLPVLWIAVSLLVHSRYGP